MSNQHVLKIHKAPLEALLSGAKTCEIRFNDRGFQVGDTVVLREVNPVTEAFTGRPDHVRTISHIQTGYGLPDGLCVLSYAQAEQQEAQGAQAGDDELAHVMAWVKHFHEWFGAIADGSELYLSTAAMGRRHTNHLLNRYARAALATQPAAAPVAAGEPAEPGEVGRAEFEAECRKQHRDITRNDVRGFEWGYLNHLTHDRWCGFNMAVRCMGLDRAPPAAAHGDEAVRSLVGMAGLYNTAQEELDALRKDAERYRWLRDPAYTRWGTMFKLYRAGAELDSAIDAAMRAQGNGEVPR